MKEKRKRNRLLICLAAFAAAAGILCLLLLPALQQSGSGPFRLSAWVAYWNWDSGVQELGEMKNMPQSVEAFAAAFDQSDRLFMPDGMDALQTRLKALQTDHPGMRVDLSVVNDRKDADGKWSEKDSGLTDRLMQSAESREANIADILAMADGFGGVEIDYENISDQSWSNFADFTEKLYQALQQQGKHLRVVLEPNIPAARLNLPPGPEYVIMAYNLHDGNTQPGPKADKAFIRKITAKMNALPGSKSIAFATGGYDWFGGAATELTESQAYALFGAATQQRDSASGALHFTYQNDGIEHTVWYADGATLKMWFDLAWSLGCSNVSLWQLGGERPETLAFLGSLNTQ